MTTNISANGKERVYKQIVAHGNTTMLQLRRAIPDLSTDYISVCVSQLIRDGRILKDDKKNWPPVYMAVVE